MKAVELRIEEMRKAPGPFSYGSTAGLGPIVMVPITAILVVTTVGRALLGFVMGTLWVCWGMPVVALAAVAEQLDNPSYFKVGKFGLYIVAVAMAVWGRR